MKSIFYLVIFLVSLLIVLRLLFRKGEIHFKLLKSLYPQKLKNVKSYYQLIFSFRYFLLGVPNILWLACPIYFSLKREFKEPDNALQNKLFKNNLYLVASSVVYILWLTLGYWIFFN